MGLLRNFYIFVTESNLGSSLYEEKIPIDVTTDLIAKEFELMPTTCALSGGEDYELLFTISQKDYEKVKDLEDICYHWSYDR